MPHLLAPGTDVAGYRIESLLGEGATGAVHLARDADGRAVALKVLDPTLAADSRFRERFLRESQIAALLEHPSVVPVLHAGEHEGLPRTAFVHEVVLGLRRRHVEPIRDPVGDDAVQLLGHRAVEAPQPCLDMGEEHLALGGHERTGQR